MCCEIGNIKLAGDVDPHRWAIPGPDGADRDTIQKSPQVTAISQFEDTRIFGPANSFVFTIQQGSFSGAIETAAVGEWHMHCHVLMHMEDGMMGSLLVRNGSPPRRADGKASGWRSGAWRRYDCGYGDRHSGCGKMRVERQCQ
jgi:hypothetical protein